MLTPWLEFLHRINKPPKEQFVLALDPGDTTGYALFENGHLRNTGVIRNHNKLGKLYDIIYEVIPDVLVVESYNIYAHKLHDHAFSNVPTLQYIGVIKFTAERLGLDIKWQSAQQAKGFATNKKLREWELYHVGNNHVNDAIRHGCYYIIFGDKHDE